MDRESLARIKKASFQLGKEAGLKQALAIISDVNIDKCSCINELEHIINSTNWNLVKLSNNSDN